MPIPRNSRPGRAVQLLVLADRLAYETSLSSFQTVATTAPIDYGAYVETITPQLLIDNASGQFTYQITGEYSLDGVTWSDFSSDVLSSSTTTGNVVGSAYTATSVGLRLRFSLGVKTTGGSASGATVTAVLALALRT